MFSVILDLLYFYEETGSHYSWKRSSEVLELKA